MVSAELSLFQQSESLTLEHREEREREEEGGYRGTLTVAFLLKIFARALYTHSRHLPELTAVAFTGTVKMEYFDSHTPNFRELWRNSYLAEGDRRVRTFTRWLGVKERQRTPKPWRAATEQENGIARGRL